MRRVLTSWRGGRERDVQGEGVGWVLSRPPSRGQKKAPRHEKRVRARVGVFKTWGVEETNKGQGRRRARPFLRAFTPTLVRT
ncbi:MAG: hypothetical protein BJ554DRAFT_61 [Olpidium bornovanus]|uniref:Uncharacterized protein n=1 Tax=Olpidium bornovanus TaxID=278681 RepID=A0A8H7ZUX6_9FUNG|nr:MAG: hypothetical protein BJ554DRAFT_61 [Olpidium bornovanus]